MNSAVVESFDCMFLVDALLSVMSVLRICYVCSMYLLCLFYVSVMSVPGKWLACQCMDNQIMIFGVHNNFRLNRKKSFKGHMVSRSWSVMMVDCCLPTCSTCVCHMYEYIKKYTCMCVHIHMSWCI